MKKILIIALLLLLFASFPAWAGRLSVSVREANVRSGPGTNYDVLWQVEKYHPVEVVKTKGDWVLFKDFEGDEAWLSKSLLRNTEAVITKGAKCNVRSGPGKQHGVVFRAERGVPFMVLGKKGRWVHVRHGDGSQGWIYDTLVW